MRNIIITFALTAIFAFTGFGQTIIPDNTNISGTWNLTGSPYIIEGRAIVPNGQTLTIEPGVEIRLQSSASPTPSWFNYGAGNVGVIRVQGEIIANGTSVNPIVFTRNNTGFWGTILIDEIASSNSSFSHCVIEYAKESRNVTGITSVVSFGGGISIFKTSISFNNNQLRNNNINGIYIKGVNTLFEFANNTIFANGTNGVVINESIVHCINNTFYNNSNNATGHVSAISSSNSTVFFVGNLIYNNQGFGIFTTNGGNNYIVNNTIFGNFNGIRVENGANTFIHNSIIQNNTTNFATSSTGGATIEMQYSLTNSASFPVNVTNVAGNILNSNAIFTNTAINDFSLQSTSPCIDAGNPVSAGLNIPNLDIIGNNRIDNSIIDMGAIEFQQPITYTVTTSSNPAIGGTTIGDGNYTSGSIVTVNATANANYVFVNWVEGATVVSTDNEYIFTITSSRNLIANFESTLSINPIEFDNQEIVIYPNPTIDYITIDYKDFNKAMLYTLDGKEIGQYQTQFIDLSYLNEGAYLLIIENTTGRKIVRKIVKK